MLSAFEADPYSYVLAEIEARKKADKFDPCVSCRRGDDRLLNFHPFQLNASCCSSWDIIHFLVFR